MRTRRFCFNAFLIAVTVVSFTVAAHAQTTVVDTELGGMFTGDIAVAGGDVVQGRFAAAGGETITLTVQAATGSSLEPSVTIRDDNGTPLSGGISRVIAWMGVGNITHVFSIPTAGVYLAEIGGISGSGSFSASLSGSPVASPLVTVSGTITDSATSNPIVGATVTADANPFDTSDASGNFAGQLAPGTYSFVFTASGYMTDTQSVTVTAGTPINDLDVALDPDTTVTVTITVAGSETVGGTVTVAADVMPAGTVVNSYAWSLKSGADVTITDADMATATVVLGDLEDYKDALVHHLEEPPVTAAQLPPNVPLPPGEFHGGLQDRLQVVGVNPFSLEEAAVVVLEVAVDTNLGVFHGEAEVHVAIPWKVATGLRNVPTDVPVLLQAKEHTLYDWNLSVPAGSTAMLSDSMTRHPYFTPDVPGLYRLTLADVPSGSTTLEVHAGTWRGVIIDEDMNGRPVPDTACTFCHNDGFAPDKFTDWKETGHAEIFTDNLNTSPYWGTQCFSCHTVGYDPDADNGGIDEAADYAGFLTLLGNPAPTNWSTTLTQYGDTAQLANIQCENCHGPQNSSGHGFPGAVGEPRIDISSDVCATCHGEPLRHARFQQWQLSGHANYELAVDEGDSGSCSRCHTGNGFLTWLPVLLDNDPMTDPLDDIFYCDDDVTNTCVGGANDGQACVRNSDCPPTWTPDEVHPQTCVTCHDPHAIGTTTGASTNATVRISGDTPPLIAGFTATDVGRGAICMTCHNSRRGTRNDSVWDTLPTSEKARAPHGSAQADMLMGQNAYLVSVDQPGGHGAMVTDTCADCHMVSTPPPDALAYNQGGTNHTFFADRNICADCHSPNLSPDDVQVGIQNLMDVVEDLIESGLYDLIDDLTNSGMTIDLNGAATIDDAALIAEIQFGEYRGRHSMTVTFTNMTVSGPHRMTDIDVLNAGTPTPTLYDFADDDLMKAGWNWNLVNNDGSRGVHNPFFAADVLTAARDALLAAQTPGLKAPANLERVRSGASFRPPRTTDSRRSRR